MNFRFHRNTLFSLLVLGFLYYAYRYIQASTFVFEGRQYFALFDDAMISMRYACNLAHGNGLVWNPAPFAPVEGYTSFAWVAGLYLVCIAMLAFRREESETAVPVLEQGPGLVPDDVAASNEAAVAPPARARPSRRTDSSAATASCRATDT